MQTITISSTTSVNPVRQLGHRKVKSYTKGARTFAGSMIFTVIDKDPFQELFAFDALNTAVRSDGKWHIDMLPPFDAIITGVNEGGAAGVQIIQGITLTNTGTTYSVDDMYTESTYTYVAEHVTPFIKNPNYDKFLNFVRSKMSVAKTPDALLQAYTYNPDIKAQVKALLDVTDQELGFGTTPPGSLSINLGNGVIVSDPALISALQSIPLPAAEAPSDFYSSYELGQDDFYNLRQ